MPSQHHPIDVKIEFIFPQIQAQTYARRLIHIRNVGPYLSRILKPRRLREE